MKKQAPGCCLGDLLGMKSYTVINGHYFMAPMKFPDPGTLNNQDASMEFVRPFLFKTLKTIFLQIYKLALKTAYIFFSWIFLALWWAPVLDFCLPSKETNISSQKWHVWRWFSELPVRWDMLIPWRVLFLSFFCCVVRWWFLMVASLIRRTK